LDSEIKEKIDRIFKYRVLKENIWTEEGRNGDWKNCIMRSFMWSLWWTKWHRGRFSPSTSVFPANSHFTECSTIINIRG
jgi:hypothetical protein